MYQRIPMTGFNFPHHFQVNFKGTVQFQEWYKMLYDWLIRQGFRHDPSGDLNIEDYHLEIQMAGGTLKNRWIWWRTVKHETDMFDYEIKVDFQTIAMKKIEIVHNGQKVDAYSGELNLFIRGTLIVDPNKMWSKNWISQQLYDVIKRKHFTALIEEKKADFYEKVLELYDRAKQSLGLYTVEPRDEPFVPIGGYPEV